MRKVVAFLFLFLTFTASWVLWERHEVTSCFNSPYCILEKLNAPAHSSSSTKETNGESSHTPAEN